MSLPKIGSVTAPVVEYGTRWTHSWIVSHAPATAPATPSATRSDRPAMAHLASGAMSGTSPASKPAPPTRMPEPKGPPGPNGLPPLNGGSPRSRALCSVCRCDSVQRSIVSLRRPGLDGSRGGTMRPAIQRLASRKASVATRPMANSPACAPRRVQNTLSKPTLLYQATSVQRLTTVPNRNRKAAMAATTTTRPARRISWRADGGSPPSSGPPTGRRGRLPPPRPAPVGRCRSGMGSSNRGSRSSVPARAP